jgi:hypothetical protein
LGWGEAGEEDHSKAKACQASNPYVGISGTFSPGMIVKPRCVEIASVCSPTQRWDALDLTIENVKKKTSVGMSRSMAYHAEVQHVVVETVIDRFKAYQAFPAPSLAGFPA